VRLQKKTGIAEALSGVEALFAGLKRRTDVSSNEIEGS